MINKLILRNFKCFDNLELDFSPVNILTGLNGMGKSTVLQSILLLFQSVNNIKNERNLVLNGKYINLGVGQDILYEKAEEDEIEISFCFDGLDEKYVFEYISESDKLPVKKAETDPELNILEKYYNSLFYLSAYRIEPQLLYNIENDEDVERRYFGKNGEYAIQYLKKYAGDEVKNKSVLIGEKLTLFDQVKAWLNIIAPGVSPVIDIDMSSRKAQLKYEYIEDREKTNSYKSINVGFGITYVLPIVVGLVAARKGDIILIENPEAHIHPKGQRMLGELIAAAGAGGVQVIVETHSDHILNGIRVAVKKEKLEPEKAGFFFFYKDMDDCYKHKILQPKVDKNGRLNEWPEGFFDEWDNALMELL